MGLPSSTVKTLAAASDASTGSVVPFTKRCQHCKENRSIEEFRKNSNRPDGYQHYCFTCSSEYKKTRLRTERDKSENLSKQNGKLCTSCGLKKDISNFSRNESAQDRYNYRCKECVNEYMKKRKPKIITLFQRRKNMLWTTYRIRYHEYMRILETQSYQCIICKKPHDDKNPLVVDHCHDKGHVRGLLCVHCNTAIGFFKNNPIACRIAAEYLERTK